MPGLCRRLNSRRWAVAANWLWRRMAWASGKREMEKGGGIPIRFHLVFRLLLLWVLAAQRRGEERRGPESLLEKKVPSQGPFPPTPDPSRSRWYSPVSEERDRADPARSRDAQEEGQLRGRGRTGGAQEEVGKIVRQTSPCKGRTQAQKGPREGETDKSEDKKVHTKGKKGAKGKPAEVTNQEENKEDVPTENGETKNEEGPVSDSAGEKETKSE